METYGSDAAAGDGKVEVGIAEYAVSDDSAELSTFGLGSCVAVTLYDPEATVSGLAHVMLPASSADGTPEDIGKFADSAIRAMIHEMEELGGDRSRMQAKVVGGSEMFDFSGIAEGVGRRNVEAVRGELESLGIPIEAEDVGGDHGRSVTLDGETGQVRMKTADSSVTEL